ncbi:MAG: Rqc2 family fibronectin-binding protein [Anaerovoracaceae bacterium]|jgi:predicted ribosome quality control (RQC) complex YloA/Tae2 family protein
MAFDGIAVRALARELDAALAGARIEKIYQPEKDELIFHVRGKAGKLKVYASSNNAHPGIFLTENGYDNPVNPPGFCMMLRKLIQGGRIVSVRQKDTERIIEVTVSSRDELGVETEKKLIVEIMGKYSNVTLLHESGKIAGSLKRITPDMDRARQVLPGMMYEYPPRQKKIPFTEVTKRDIEAMCGESAESGRPLSDVILGDVGGLSPAAAREAAMPGSPDGVFAKIEEMRERVSEGDITPVVYEDSSGKPKDFHVIRIDEYENIYNRKDFGTVSAAAEYYYTHREQSNRINQKSAAVRSAVNKALKKQRLKKQRLSEDLMKARDDEKYRLYGELVTANIHLIKPGATEATVTNYYDGSEITIPLDERYSAAKNAQIFFKKYSKSRTALKEKSRQLKETDANIEYLLSVKEFADEAETVEDIDRIRDELEESGFARRQKHPGTKKKDVPHPYSYKTSDGFDVLAGRNNRENDYLTFRTAGRNDIWFHTKDIPGSHVILFLRGRKATDRAIFEAASIAAYHSKGRNSENVPVDYTEVRYVKKPGGAKPGMVIFTDNHTVYVTPKRPGSLTDGK